MSQGSLNKAGIIFLCLSAVPLMAMAGVGGSAMAMGQAAEHWVGTWASSQQLVEPHNMPPSPGLANNTLRQVVRVSIGGERIRLKLSNEYGDLPLEIKAVHLAQSAGAHRIKPETSLIVTFNGEQAVVIPPGETVVSDPLDYLLPSLTAVAITINFGAVPGALTGHPGSRTTSYISTDSAVDPEWMTGPVPTEHWYVISGIDICTENANAAAVVAIGDSITDGRGSTTNRQNRWPDILANRLQADQSAAHIGVLNHGIGGNAVLHGGLGPTVFRRFKRDVLEQPGVRYLIILAGVNDIGGSHSLAIADNLISVFQHFVEQAHDCGILVYGGTILPFGGSQYYTPVREQARQKFNEWVRTSGVFDAVIDFDAALRDPGDPERLLNLYDTGDHLHPNAEGYKRMGEFIDLTLFTK
ncbi:MAG: SGNH/GDSL hydrolase family protein [Bacillota bacterium]|nr:SGNH/GDSL hydrolase family protein [Bacillota bacterium]